MATRRNFRLLFLKKKIDNQKVLDYYFLDHDVAYIPCKVSGLEDVVSHYSVPDYETLDESFASYIESIMSHVPNKYPMVLEITGHKFTKKEQQVIEDAIWNHYEFKTIAAQNKRRRSLIRILWFVICLAACAVALFKAADMKNNVIKEMIFIIFWFFGDRLAEYVLLDERKINQNFISMARLASMKVVFTEKYDDEDITEEEAEEFREEILENIESQEI